METAKTSIDHKTTVCLSPTSLAEVWAFALQSGEFVGLPHFMADAGTRAAG